MINEVNNNEPKVSVVIPVYNTENYVHDAIDSICKQTLRNIEIIIIDDGSTDGSYPIIKKMADKDSRIQIFRQKNCGLSMTRNIGLEYSKGTYIYFMDSDDLLEKDALELSYEKCEKEKLDFVFFNAESFCENSNITNLQFNYAHTCGFNDRVYNGIDIFNMQVEKHQFTPSVCLRFIRHSLLINRKLFFYPRIVHEDQLFMCLLYLQSNRVGLIHRNFFHRRLRPGSIMTRHLSWKNIDGYLVVARELTNFAEKTGDKAIYDSVFRYLSQMLDAVVWEAHVLPQKERWRLLFIMLTHYRNYVTRRSLAVLLLKKKK